MLAPCPPLGYCGAMKTEITLRRPDDWHLHLRDGAMLAGVLPALRGRISPAAIVMPNLVPPVGDRGRRRVPIVSGSWRPCPKGPHSNP